MIIHLRILALAILILSCSLLSYGQDRVGIYGVVSVVKGSCEGLNFVVYGEGLVARKVEISRKGKFYFTLPVDQVAFIRCAKTGYLTKRVKIDTHFAFVTKYNARYNKEVDFDLEMIPQIYKAKEGYLGPIAYISFNKQSGLLKIKYDYRKREPNNMEGLIVETQQKVKRGAVKVD